MSLNFILLCKNYMIKNNPKQIFIKWAVSDFIKSKMDSNKNIYYLSSDWWFINDIDHSIDTWIAEQNLIGIAAWIALKWNKVIISSISSFMIQNAYMFIRNLISYNNLDVIMIWVWSWISYNAHWFTHHSLEDIWLIKLLPNFKILMPADWFECIKAIEFAIENKWPFYIRFSGFLQDEIFDCNCYKPTFTKPEIIISWNTVAILSYWPILWELIKTVKKLQNNWIYPTLIHIQSLFVYDLNIFKNELSWYKYIFVVEEHILDYWIYHEISNHLGWNAKIFSIWYPKKFIDYSWDINFIREKNGMDCNNIYKKILKSIWKKL